MQSDTRIKTYAINYSLSVKTFHFGISIKLIKIADTQSQIRIGEKFHRLSFFQPHEQRVDILLYRTFLQKFGKSFCRIPQLIHIRHLQNCLILLFKIIKTNEFGESHDNTARIEIVIQCLALTKKLRREKKIKPLHSFPCIFHIQATTISYRDG